MKNPRLDHDAERIRQLLTQVTPDDPGVNDRVLKVARRARRNTRRGIVSVVAVFAAAAAVVIAPHFLTTSPTTNEATDPSNGVRTDKGEQTVDPFTTTPCPHTPLDLGTAAADQETTDAMRADATSIRLCTATVGGVDAMPWRPPADALQLSLGDPFMSEAAASPEADEHRCDAFRVAPDPSTFVVGYPDRGTETVAVSNMCTDLAVNGKELAAPAVLVLFEDALAAQRERLTPNSAKNLTFDCIAAVDPGGHAEVPTTRGPRPAAETRFVRFVSCMGKEPVAVDIDAVTKLNEQWPASIRDMATQLPLDVDRCPAVDVDVPATYGVTTWGDVLEFRFRGCGNYIVRGDAESNADAFGPQTLQFLPPKELADALGLLYDLT